MDISELSSDGSAQVSTRAGKHKVQEVKVLTFELFVLDNSDIFTLEISPGSVQWPTQGYG